MLTWEFVPTCITVGNNSYDALRYWKSLPQEEKLWK
jgi:hypothetical protein